MDYLVCVFCCGHYLLCLRIYCCVYQKRWRPNHLWIIWGIGNRDTISNDLSYRGTEFLCTSRHEDSIVYFTLFDHPQYHPSRCSDSVMEYAADLWSCMGGINRGGGGSGDSLLHLSCAHSRPVYTQLFPRHMENDYRKYCDGRRHLYDRATAAATGE